MTSNSSRAVGRLSGGRGRRALARRRLAFSLVAAAAAAAAAPSAASAQTWAGGTGTWNAAGNWTPAAVPASSASTQLTFTSADATGYTATNDIGTGTFTLNRLTVNNTGTGTVTIAGAAAANTLTFAGTTPTIDAPAGTTLFLGLMAGSATVTKVGAGTFLHDSDNAGFTGTLVVNAGTFVNRSTAVATTNFNPVSIVVNDGATYQFGAATVGNPNLPNGTYITANAGGTVVWDEGEDFGGFVLNGGTLHFRAGGANLQGSAATELRSGAITNVGSNTLAGAGVVNKTTAGTVTVTNAVINNQGGVNIQNGVLSTNAGFNAAGTLSFGTNGAGATTGTLRYTGATPAAALAKPVLINDGGGVIEVATDTTSFTYSGIAAGTGALRKDGPGTLVLAGNNTFAGGTTVAAGTLQLGSGGTAGTVAGNVSVAAGATLAFQRSDNATFAGAIGGAGAVRVQGDPTTTISLTGALAHAGPTSVTGGTLKVAPFAATGGISVAGGAGLHVVYPTAAGTFSTPTLSLGAGGTGPATLRLALDTATNPTVPLLGVTAADGLQLNGSDHTIVVSNTAGLKVGTVPLIQYAGTDVTSGFTLGGLPARTVGALAYDTAAKRVNLQVTAVDSVRWTGATGTAWDTGGDINVGGTNNFRLASNGAATNFVANDAVAFDDSANGAGAVTVDVPSTVEPSSVTMNNSAARPYTFQGAGGIGGAGTLTKQGAGTLTVLTNNGYTGGTTVAAGTVNVGNGGTTGDLGGTGPIVNNGAIVWNRSDDVTVNAPISGTGSLSKPGTNTLTVVGAFTPSGPTSLGGGGLALDAASDYTATGPITGTATLTKRGQGVVTLAAVALTGDTFVESGTLVIGNGGTTGSLGGNVSVNGAPGANGTIAFNRSDTVTYAGNISVGGGGTTAKIMNVGPGNTILTGVITQPSVTQAGAIVAQAGTLTFANPNVGGVLGTVTAAAAGTVVLDTTAGDQTFTNVFAGPGTIVKKGPGTVTLTGANSFTGTFRADVGLTVLADPNVAGGDLNATSIIVNGGATFQFGQGGISGENPDIPEVTYITVNPGGNVVWRVGEQIGGLNLQGGTVTLDGGGITRNLATESWTSGTLTTSGTTALNVGGVAVVVKTTPGTVTVGGAATINSPLNVQDGSVVFTAAANLGSAAVQLGVAGGTAGTIEYQGATATRGGAFTLNGPGTVRVATATTALTLSGAMSGAGTLTKDGPGTLTLTGNNTFAGGTSVTAGTLRVNGQTGANSGTGTGPVAVGPNGAVGGTGSIAGTLSVSGAVRPGASVGRLTAGATTLNPGATWQVEMSDAGGAAGTGWDLLQGQAGAGVTFAGMPASPLVVQLVSVDGTGAAAAAANFDPTQPGAWTIASYPGGVAGFNASAVQVSLAGFANPTNGGTFAVSPNGNDVVLTFTPVPEPGAVGATAVAAAGLLARRRARRR